MWFAQGKNPACFICFGIGNLSNFAVVKMGIHVSPIFKIHHITEC